MNKSFRNSNIELLRILLMFMIITHHLIVHGLDLENIGHSKGNIDQFSLFWELLINSFVVIGVNTFVFISGYYGMKFKLKTIISFVVQAFFYSVCIYLIVSYFNHSFGIKGFVKSLFPISTDVWWFLTLYLGLYFLAPILNKGIDSIEFSQMSILLLGLLFFDCFSGFLFRSIISGNGYSIFNFITIYILARYLSKYLPEINKSLLYLTFSSLLIFCITLIFLHFRKLSFIWLFFSYNNPLIILSSIFIFYAFKNIKLQNNKIELFSGFVFGIYLIHDHLSVREIITSLIFRISCNCSGIYFVFIFVLVILSIFLICLLIEVIRNKVFNPLVVKLESIIERKCLYLNNRYLTGLNLSNPLQLHILTTENENSIYNKETKVTPS